MFLLPLLRPKNGPKIRRPISEVDLKSALTLRKSRLLTRATAARRTEGAGFSETDGVQPSTTTTSLVDISEDDDPGHAIATYLCKISKKSEWEAFLTETYVLDMSVGGVQPSTSSLDISETDDGLV